MTRFILLMAAGLALVVLVGITRVDAGVLRTFGLSPAVSIHNAPQHVYAKGGQVIICAAMRGKIRTVHWSTKRMKSTHRPKGSTVEIAESSSHRSCVKYTSPATRGWDAVKVVVTDSQGGSDWDAIRLCVLMDDFTGTAPRPGNNCYRK